MTRTTSLAAYLSLRPLVALQIFALVLAPGCIHPGALDPRPGVLDYRAPLAVSVSGAVVDVAGGNLVSRRIDLSIDTQVGPVEIGAVYNSTSRAWIWPFEVSYDGVTFVDESGAVHDMTSIAPDAAVPGTHWVKVDATRIKTKGGLVHTFDPVSHRLLRVAWGIGTFPELVYDVADVSGVVRVVGMSQCDGFGICRFVYGVAYDQNGCVSNIDDRAGRVADFVNDAQCRPTIARDGLDVARGWPGRRYTYAAGLLTSVTTSEGERTAYAYLDGRIALVRQVGDGARTTRFEYGNDPTSGFYFTRVRDVRGEESVYRYDGEGRLYGHRNAVGDEATYAWSAMRPTSWTDAAGATTTWTYDGDDPISAVLPSGNQLSFLYAPDAHDRSRPFARPLLQLTDSLGLIEARVYDAAGHLESVANGAGEVTGYARFGNGLVSMISSPDGTITWLDGYGEHGHPTEAIRSTYTERRQYDAVGNLIEGADIRAPLSPGRPGIRRLVYDEDRNVASVERVGSDVLGGASDVVHSLDIERGSDGRILRITRPYGGDAEHVYDGFGDLVERRERVGGVWRSTSFEYDAAGATTAVELANGMRREMSRDAVGRVVGLTLLDDGVEVQTSSSTFAAGRLVARLDSVHGVPELFFHDAAGRVDRIVHPSGEVVELTYDVRSREVGRTYRMMTGAPALRSIERSYDAAGREIELRDQGVPVLTRQISAGRIDEIAYANGLVRRFEYEPTFGLLTATRTEPESGGLWVEETRVTWAECAQSSLCLTTRTDIPGDPAGLPGLLTYEGYRLGPVPAGTNPLGTPGLRLETSMPDDAPSTLEPPAPEYAFDALGNWLGVMDGGQPQIEFVWNDERNRLLAAQGAAQHGYAWDEAGFLVDRDGESFAWSPHGRPTAIGPNITMQWDTLGRLVSSTIDGVATRSLFGGDVLADATGVPLRLDLGEVVIDLVSNARAYRHLDFRGNVQLVTDGAGVPVLHHTYGPFGVAQTFGTHDDGQTFAGGSEIGDLMMIGARLYDPSVGRFLSPDPVYHAVNQFAYTLGNPVFLWDPSGEHAQPFHEPIADVAEVAGDYFSILGFTIVAAGVGTGNFVVAGFGAAVALLGKMLELQARMMRGCEACRVRIEDGPFNEHLEARPAIAKQASEVAEVGCSPTAISASGGVAWPSLGLIGLQLIGAVALIRRRRRRGAS